MLPTRVGGWGILVAGVSNWLKDKLIRGNRHCEIVTRWSSDEQRDFLYLKHNFQYVSLKIL